MKNEEMFGMIKESCTATAPDILPRLSFAAAEEYKNTVPASSPTKSYIKAAVIYAAACLVLVIALPFIIGNVTDHEPTKPGGEVPPVKTETTDPNKDPTESSINAEDINEVYNKVDPDTLSDKVTVEEVEKIIEAARLAYDDYDVIILKDGTRVSTMPKKPEITEDDLDSMIASDKKIVEYREYFKKLSFVVSDAITARFPERSVLVLDAEKEGWPADIFEMYPKFCVLDIEGSGYANAEKIYNKMMGAQDFMEKNICDLIWFTGVRNDTDDVLMITFAESDDSTGFMLFPADEEYDILMAELPEMRLAIEDEILAATSSKTREELIEYGYEEITHGGDTFLMREFECETGTTNFRIYNRELYITEEPYVEVYDSHIPDLEDGKIYLSADIWAADCFIKMRVTVEDDFPIVLPEGAEKELRYILNIDYTLDIAEDILSSPGVLQIDELDLNKYPYTDISKQYPEYDNAVYFSIRVPNNDYNTMGYDYGTIELLYKENHGKSIDIKVTEKSYSADEFKHMAEITICLDSCTMRVCVWTDGSNPIVLPPEVEEVLRYILNIEKEDVPVVVEPIDTKEPVVDPPKTPAAQTPDGTTTPKETSPKETEPVETVITYPAPSITKRTATSITKSLYGCEYTISVDKAGYKAGDIITVTVTLENKGESTLSFSSGSGWDYLSNIGFYEDNTEFHDTHTEIIGYPSVVTFDELTPGEKWDTTRQYCTCECDPYAEWSVKGAISFAINGEGKKESLEFEVYHALPDTFGESDPYNKLPAITDFSSTAFEKRTNPFADIESAVLYKNGATIPLAANDPMLVRLLNFMTYSDEEPYYSACTLGFHKKEDYEKAVSSNYRLEITFKNTYYSGGQYIFLPLSTYNRAVITGDEVYLIQEYDEPPTEHIGYIPEYSMACQGWMPYAHHFSDSKDKIFNILTYAGFWNYSGK